MSVSANEQEVLDALDWDVVAAVLSSSNILDSDKTDVTAMVYAASSRYLPSDLETYEILEVEKRWETTLGEFKHHGTWDLVFRHRETGEFSIADWKTTASLDKDWVERLRASWQNKIYSWALARTNIAVANQSHYRFLYRGVQRPPASFGGSQRNITFRDVDVQHADARVVDLDVEDYLGALNKYRTMLTANSYVDFWPRHMPFACNAYGRECEYCADCREPVSPKPAVAVPLASLNYSGASTLMLCPERYRRDLMKTEENTGSDETAIGTLFHAGMQCIYEQARELQRRSA